MPSENRFVFIIQPPPHRFCTGEGTETLNRCARGFIKPKSNDGRHSLAKAKEREREIVVFYTAPNTENGLLNVSLFDHRVVNNGVVIIIITARDRAEYCATEGLAQN